VSVKHLGACASVMGRAGLVAALALLGACAHVRTLAAKASPSHWSLPWHHKVPPAAETVHELMVPGSESDLPQAWDRNTLRVDLSGYAGEGALNLQRAAGHDWPIRMAFTVRPGGFGHLEVRGDQRVVLTVPADGSLVVLNLPPGLYNPTTPALALRYGP
jgi:hypothetical protein